MGMLSLTKFVLRYKCGDRGVTGEGVTPGDTSHLRVRADARGSCDPVSQNKYLITD